MLVHMFIINASDKKYKYFYNVVKAQCSSSPGEAAKNVTRTVLTQTMLSSSSESV